MLKTTPVTAGLLRPVGLFCVLFGGIAVFEYSGCGKSDKIGLKKPEPVVPQASQDVGFAPIAVFPEPTLPINHADESNGNGNINPNENSEPPENSNPVEERIETATPQGATQREEAQSEPDPTPKAEVKKKKSPNLLKLIAKLKSPPPLTAEKKEACNKVISFLEKYTPDNAFSYKSIPIFLEGVKNDEKAIQDEIKKIKFEEETAGISSNVTSEDDYRKLAQERVVKRVREGLILGLNRLGVKPPAADTSSSDGPTVVDDMNIKPVTVEILAEFQEMMDRLDLYRKEAVTMGTLTFPNKYAREDAKFTLNEKSGIPPNGEWGLAK